MGGSQQSQRSYTKAKRAQTVHSGTGKEVVWLLQKEQGREEEVIVRRTRGQRYRALQVTGNQLLFSVSDGKPLKGFEQINDTI